MPEALCATCATPIPDTALFCPACGSRTGTGAASGVEPRPFDVQGALSRVLGAKYQVRQLLGEGGFAQVYEVWDTDLERRLAVKVLKPDIAWSAGMLDRFRQETRTIARLNHANILPIHFVGEGEGLTYYAMPFVEGESLATLLRRQGALSVDRSLAIIRPLLDALSHAHGQGLIHRDIKPDNIMLEASSGRPLLVDFGIAKRLDGAGHKTQTGFVVGTPQYMSPEQALGQGDVDARSDLYAIGAVLYQMVTGTPPFEGDTSQEIVGKHLSEPAPIATAKDARIPMWLSDVIVRCLAKRPAERFQSAAMLLDALSYGRSSGAQQAVSAERVARQLQSEEATALIPSAQRPAASGVVIPPPSAAPTRASLADRPSRLSTAESPSRRAAEPPATRRWPIVMLVLAAIAVAAWLLTGRQASLTLQNRLVEPVRLTLEGNSVEVPAGGQITARVRRGRPVVAEWNLVRPLGPDGTPMGVGVQGTLAFTPSAAEVRQEISAISGQTAVFAPLITNAGHSSVGIVVNPGISGTMDCRCQVRPGVVRAHIGYYPLFRNSGVEARNPQGARATFRNVGPQVERITGSVGLRFEDANFPATP